MDNGNDNIFADGNDKSAGGLTADNGGIPDTVIRPAGRIDPAIAAAANGPGAGNSDSGGDTASRAGKRGRHPNACTCDTCNAKRQAPSGIAASEPKPEKNRNIRASFVEKTLTAIHLGLVMVTKCPEFSLDKEDASKLGEATAGVLAFYKVKMTAKQEAYALLMEAAAQVYPPMLISVYIRKKAEHDAKPKTAIAPQPLRPVPPAPRDNVQPLRGAAFDPFKIEMPQ